MVAAWRSAGRGDSHERRYFLGEALPVLAGGMHRSQVPILPLEDCPPFDAIIATVDPATASKDGDFSVIAIAGVTRAGWAYLLDLQVGRFEAKELRDRICAVGWHPTRPAGVIGIESVGFQSWLVEGLHEEQDHPCL